MATISTLTAVLQLDQSGFESGVEDAEDSLDGLQGQAQRTGERLTSAGKTMTAGITAPLAAMGALSARTAASFDQNMQQSVAVMGDVSESMREDLEQTARDVANSTTMSADQAAQSYYYLASAGLDAAQAMEAMPQVAAFAEAGQMDMAEATDTATNVMSAYGIEAENMSDVTDVMTATVTNHNQTMQGMSAAFRNAAPAAAGMGVEIEELAALTGALGDVGIQAEEAGTALNSMMRRMAKRSGEAGTALDNLGIQTTDANGELLPMIDIIRQLEEANMTSAEASAIFGRQMSAGQALVEQGADSLENYQGRLQESNGATQDVAETQRETLNAEMAQARSNIEDVGIALGSELLPMLSTLTGYVQGAAERFQGLNQGQQRAILVAGGLLAALGPVLMIAGLLAQSIVALSGAYGVLAGAKASLAAVNAGVLVPSLIATNVALGPITVPIWAIIAALGALVAVVGTVAYAFYTNAYGIRDTVTDAFSTVKGWFDAAPTWLLALMGPIGWLYAAWRENLFGIQDVVGDVFDWIGSKIDWLMGYIEKIPGVGGDGTKQADIVDVEEPDTPDVDETNWEDEFGNLGQQSGESFGESFNQSASNSINDLSTGDAEEHLKGEISDLQESYDELQEGGIALEEQGEATEIQKQIRELEGQLSEVQSAEDVSDVDPQILADAAQAQVNAEEERQNTLASVSELVEGADAEQSEGQEVTPEMVTESLSSPSDQSGQGDQKSDTLQTVVEELQNIKATLENPMDLNITDGTIETDDGHIIEIVDGRIDRRARKADVQGS